LSDIAAGWRDIETPCVSLPTPSPSQPHTPRGKPERLDDLALQLAQPAAHTIIPPPRGFSGVQIELKMVQNPDFPVVLGCAARQSRRTAKIGYQEKSMGWHFNAESPTRENWRICWLVSGGALAEAG
jgi:hypothetical protein